jgi:hypothetical protein
MLVSPIFRAIVLAFGCASSEVETKGGGDAGQESATASVSVSSSSTTRPTKILCNKRELRSLVASFTDAFNAGELERLDRLFAREPGFEWYSTDAPGARFDTDARERATLVSYFARRVAKREQLSLRSFRFVGNSNGYGHFHYALVRRADDLAPTGYVGKGAAICTAEGDVIAVWSMGQDPWRVSRLEWKRG